ncbi:MAG TPA: RHS repeat-associated core domain-containing protein, partial [Blastocatellia bacterium]|nr:RHS repeat-associated core domain-containing protein [Blastocatellia bacterium]
VQRYAYSSFGKIESQLDPSFVQPYTFTAREFDSETGLHFYRTRNYDSMAGRFIQPDLIGFLAGPNFYAYTENNPIYFVDPLGLDAIDVAANYAAGFGDMLSFGITRYVRSELGVNNVVDQCSTAYSAGWWSGMLHQLAFSGVGAFHGGARTVLYSGEGALEAARAAKGAGRLLEDTLGGKLLNLVDKHYPIPDTIWKGAAAIFSTNAKADVQVFLRNPDAGRIWSTVEKPTLDLVNKIHSAVTGAPATKIIAR